MRDMPKALRIFTLFAALSLYAAAPAGAEEESAESAAAPSKSAAEAVEYDPSGMRQRPGEDEEPIRFPPYIYESIPDIRSSASAFVPVPDRWRQFYQGKWYDPYNQNVWKGDLPIFGHPGHEWFLALTAISDTTVERLKIPVPVGGPTTDRPSSLNTLGDGRITATVQNLITGASLIRGNTTYMPPEYEFRVVTAVPYTHVESEETGLLRLNPARGSERDDVHVGFLELFADIHLTNLSERYDFVSTRLGIQDFQSDFRGFVYADQQPGVRLFGNYDNNKLQYNLAWFDRLDKDTNSGINSTFEARHENVVIANVFKQDLPILGHQIQASAIYRDDRAGDHGFHYDDNGLLRRPASIGDERSKNIYSTYFGLAADGHIKRLNTTTAINYVVGRESHSSIAGKGQDIKAWMVAQEASYDIDWVRLRGSLLYASGDKDPFDDDAEGFDAIFDNPNFAGGDLSFWQRQQIPLIGGGEVFLVNRGSLFPNMRAGKEEGQSNFVNPGLLLLNLGVDFEVTPKIKVVTNGSYLRFDETAPLETVRQDSSIGKEIGYDLSAGVIYRPFLHNNVTIRVGAATLIPGDGLKDLYGDNTLYNFFTNLILEY